MVVTMPHRSFTTLVHFIFLEKFVLARIRIGWVHGDFCGRQCKY
jgi:hypothetical protein